jgi:hypothetical protein
MRTHLRYVALAAIVLGIAGVVAAQEKKSPLLNNVAVRELVTRGEAADHARLGVHFTALEQRHATEAKRHTTMARSFAGNPNRGVGAGMTIHCQRLAELNTQSAATLRELTAYHEKLAAGAPATIPAAGARFETGAGAPAPTDQELGALAAKANTPADHRALDEYFATLAKRYAADAEAHTAQALTYRGTRIAQAAVHHERLATLTRDEAKEATAAAEMHRQLAGIAR